MSLTDADSTAMIRSLLKEGTAKFWTDAEIVLYKKASMDSVWSRYMPQLFPRYKKRVNFGVTADTADYIIATAIGSDTLKVVYVLNKEDGDKLRFILPDEYYKYRDWTTGYPVCWTYKSRTSITLIPTPGFTDADYLEAIYMPKYTDITTFPDCLQMIVCVEAAMLGKIKDEDSDPMLLELHKMYTQSALTFLTDIDVQVFPDFREEDSLE